MGSRSRSSRQRTDAGQISKEQTSSMHPPEIVEVALATNEGQTEELLQTAQSSGKTKDPIQSSANTTKESTTTTGDRVEERQNPEQASADLNINIKDSFSAEELKVIGERINPERNLAPDAHEDLVIRIKEIVKKGLPVEEKKILISKFPPPKNCLFLDPPKLNVEVKAALQESHAPIIKRDLRIMETQQKITAGLGGLMSLASLALSLEKDKKLEMLGIVSGLLRIFSDLQFEESSIRRSLILKNIDASLRDTLSSTEVDEWLFGESLEDRVKAAKALTTASGALKVKKPPGQNNQTKNFRGPPRRQTTKHQFNPNYSIPGGQRSSMRGQKSSYRGTQRQMHRGGRR